ncbi:MAG: hypothetical protein ACFFBH_01835, partial [Promethearchaeota archaeon]
MKTRKLILFSSLTIFSMILISTNPLFNSEIISLKSSNSGVSGYTITGSVTYQVEINFSLTHNNLG